MTAAAPGLPICGQGCIYIQTLRLPCAYSGLWRSHWIFRLGRKMCFNQVECAKSIGDA